MSRASPLIVVLVAAGCAGAPETKRPIPGGDPAASMLFYIYPVPPPRAYDAALAAFQSVFGKTVSFAEKENAANMAKFGRYGEIHTTYLYYEEKETKYRKQCRSYVIRLRSILDDRVSAIKMYEANKPK